MRIKFLVSMATLGAGLLVENTNGVSIAVAERICCGCMAFHQKSTTACCFYKMGAVPSVNEKKNFT